MPDWRPTVKAYLRRFEAISCDDIDRAEQWAANSSMFYAAGSWRAKVINGSLWVKMIRAHSHWAERASILRLIMLALEGLPGLPDFEIVYAHCDKDPTPPRGWPKCPAGAAGCRSWPIPLFRPVSQMSSAV